MSAPGVWMADWIWSFTYLLSRKKRLTIKASKKEADAAVARYKKRMRR